MWPGTARCNHLIFHILGDDPQKVIVRASGPSLPVTGKLADPVLELHNPDGSILASNENWYSAQDSEIMDTGMPPTNDLESAIVATLPPEAYTYPRQEQHDWGRAGRGVSIGKTERTSERLIFSSAAAPETRDSLARTQLLQIDRSGSEFSPNFAARFRPESRITQRCFREAIAQATSL